MSISVAHQPVKELPIPVALFSLFPQKPLRSGMFLSLRNLPASQLGLVAPLIVAKRVIPLLTLVVNILPAPTVAVAFAPLQHRLIRGT